MPRKSRLLPYLQLNRVGRLSYVRRIPADLRPYAGNRTVIRRSLGVTSVDCSSPMVIKAWTAVNGEVEELLATAKQRIATGSALMTVDTAVVRPDAATFPLSKREVAGIAGQVLLDIRNAVADQQLMSPDYTDAVTALAMKAQTQGISKVSAVDFAVLARPTLKSLGITPTPIDMQAIGEALLGYFPIIQADMQKLSNMNYSSPRLAEIAPPIPQRKVTWEQLVNQYQISVGGTTETVGQGVSEDRIKDYWIAIKDICKSTGKSFPDALTINDIRHYVNELMQGTLAIKTQQKKLTMISHLYKIGVQYGLLNHNPVQNITIKQPKGSKQNTYRSFTRDELVSIFKRLKQIGDVQRQWVIEALLCSGARSAEVVRLRHSDIKRTKAGVYYFDFTHDPQGKYPTSLKGGEATARKTPLHPRLIERDYLGQVHNNSEGYITTYTKETSGWTGWFKEQLLVPLSIYSKGSTGLHSLRNTAIDLWRECGVDQEFRRAFVAHAAQDVQDKIYGTGLKNMPDVMAKEMQKVDLSWLS